MKEHQAAVIVINWNGRRFLEDCLGSLSGQTYSPFSVFLVDNASTDGSTEYVRSRFPSVEVIALDKNLEFAAANNIAMRAAMERGAEFIALLNNDTKAQPGWLSALVRVMRTDQRIGMCASKMLRMNEPGIIDSAGHVFVDGILHDRGSGEPDKGQYDDKTEVVGGCGGAVLYRARMLAEIGLLDEKYGFNYEDAELSWRAHNRGWKARFVPDAVVYHVRGGSVETGSALQKELSRRGMVNLVRTLRRHATIRQKLLVSAIWAKEAMRGDPQYLKRLAMFWTGKGI